MGNPCDYCINGDAYGCDMPDARPDNPRECPYYEGIDVEDAEDDRFLSHQDD